MKKKYVILIIIIICIPVITYIVTNYLYRRTLRRMLDRPPVGITYVEPENFEFPDIYGVCMGQGPRIVIRNPKTLKTREIASNLPSRNIAYASTVDNGKTVYFITGDLFLMKYTSEGMIEIVSAYGLSTFSVSPDNRFIAYVAGETSSNERKSLYLYDVNSQETSVSLKYAGSFVPPIWISSDRIIIDHTKGIVSYDITTKQMKVIIAGPYYAPVLWKNEYLIFSKDDDSISGSDSVYISKIDGSDLKFFCKNQFIFGCPSISPDDRYLAFLSRYVKLAEDEIVNLYDLRFGTSLCVIDIASKTFTYYLAPKDLVWEGPNDRYEFYYPFQLSWSYFPATK